MEDEGERESAKMKMKAREENRDNKSAWGKRDGEMVKSAWTADAWWPALPWYFLVGEELPL